MAGRLTALAPLPAGKPPRRGRCSTLRDAGSSTSDIFRRDSLRFRLNPRVPCRTAQTVTLDEIVYAHKLKFLIFLIGAPQDRAC
ncbi:hypothetical protein P355_3409 [Burkholderia cenocepacia KC-01]|nr:hypothetical protein P355_3409 [Burkholderia cenocepacia KC-01]